MRRVLGGLVLVAGVGGLGWFASTNQAVQIETGIAQAANDIAAQGVHGISAAVSGRDITLSGTTESAEVEAIRAKVNAVPGRRVITTDTLEILPVVSPFEMMSDGTGVVPDEATRNALRPTMGDAVNQLQLADGEPDAVWGDVAVQASTALGVLKTGEFKLTDRDLTVSGLAATPTDVADFDAALEGLPAGYTVTTDIDVEDDGTPMRLDLEFDARTLRGTGKIPVDLKVADISVPGAAQDIEIIQGRIAAPHDQWAFLAKTGIQALDDMGVGTLTIEGQTLRLTGQFLPERKDLVDDAVQAMRDAAPDFEITTDIKPFDDGKPYALNASYDGEKIIASGKVPADFGDGLDDNVTGTITRADLKIAATTDDNGTWPAIAHAGLNALATLDDGTLTIDGDQITLSGTTASPDAYAATTAALGDFTSAGDITFLDDGTPIRLALTYFTDSAAVSGKLPADLTPTDVAEALGIAVTDDGTTQSTKTSDIDLLGPLLAITDVLPEIDRLTYTNGPDGAQFDAIAVPGVDADQLGALLTTTLGDDAQVSVTAATDIPANGTTRTNRFTGRPEVFTAGNWLPEFDFTSTIETCTEQSDAVLADSKVRFLSGSAQLTVPSIRAINGLSALARKCALEGGLFLTISGHTDNTGDADANLALSQARADAVRDAILGRGVAQAAVTATGFGDSDPIADNATEDGRAANRRTEFRWVFE